MTDGSSQFGLQKVWANSVILLKWFYFKYKYKNEIILRIIVKLILKLC